MRAILCGLSLCLVLISLAANAAQPSLREEVREVREQVQGLDKDVAILKGITDSRLDMQDKRIGDIDNSTETSLAGISNSTTWIGGGIAFIALLASFAAYFTARDRAIAEARVVAKAEAREIAQQLVKEEAIALWENISGLQKEAMDALQEIGRLKTEVDAHAAKTREEIDQAAQQILSRQGNQTSDQPTDPSTIIAVRQVNQVLESKPEKDFTSEDHFARGLNDFLANRFDSALLHFEKALNQAQVEAVSPEKYIRLMLTKAATLGQLGRNQEAIAILDEVDRRYREDDSSAVREQVAIALVNKGLRLDQLGRSQEEIAVYEEIDRRYSMDGSPALREQVAIALFNKGVTLGQLDCSDEAIAVYNEIDRRYSDDNSPALREQVVNALVNKGFRLGQLNHRESEIAVYDEIDRRYGWDESRVMREQVAIALNSRAFTRLLLAKQSWPLERTRRRLIAQALEDLRHIQRQCREVDRAMVLGNLGYALFLSGEIEQAEEPTRECLLLGGEKLLQGQRNDAQLHRVEPEDTEYEKLLDRLWNELHPKPPN